MSEEWECPGCNTSPYLMEGMEIPEHKLCGPCASDAVTQHETAVHDLKKEIRGMVEYAENWIKNYGATPGLHQLTHDETKSLAGMKTIAELVEKRL